MRSTARNWLMGLAVVTFTAMAVWSGAQQPATARQSTAAFPHVEHEHVFPVCTGCHAGLTETGAPTFPEPEMCAQCHDGDKRDRVEWALPRPRRSNVRFNHVEHAAEAECRQCHVSGEGRMGVAMANSAACFECHEIAPDDHLATGTPCALCHDALASSPSLSSMDIAGFPQPPSHSEPEFALDHAGLAEASMTTCAVCHTRDSCTVCHRNSEGLRLVAGLPSDPRVAELTAGKVGHYPEPPSHDDQWIQKHGRAALLDIDSCANCHVQSSCRTCHADGEARVFAEQLPSLRAGERALIARQPDDLFHRANFRMDHAIEASLEGDTCASCHSPQTCTSCHDGMDSASFHGANFLERHGADVYGARSECSTCHSVEGFCRGCHQDLKLAQTFGTATFHDRQPQWLLAHGQAARQDLVSCASCHAQTDCTRCHAARGGWSISPHGPGFDPQAMADANRITCLVCHPSDPLGGF